MSHKKEMDTTGSIIIKLSSPIEMRTSYSLLALAIAMKLESCQPLSGNVADRASTKTRPQAPPYHLRNRHLRFPLGLDRSNHTWRFYPDGVPPPDYSRETYERYISLHQSVRKRRSIRRLYDIAVILLGHVLRPLVCSLTTGGKKVDDWEAFWSRESRKRQRMTNAQRLAQGFQQLGPTFVKMAQAVASRPDLLENLHPSLKPVTDTLTSLHDNMLPFDSMTARRIVRQDLIENIPATQNGLEYDMATRKAWLESFPVAPAAAASMAQVYKAYLPGYGYVAVKVQRPGIRRKVERDATLFHSLATWLESASRWRPRVSWTSEDGFHLEWVTIGKKTSSSNSAATTTVTVKSNNGLIKVVDEFTERVLEDMDFRREVANMVAFAELYSHRTGVVHPEVRVVVPQVIPELCSERVITMEWIEGNKLTEMCENDDYGGSEQQRPEEDIVAENLALVEKAIECTLSQLLDSGVLHADPHPGNLLKVRLEDGEIDLGYLDFGLVSFVPQSVRDGIVCAVVQVVFARNIEAVADLCTDLELLPKDSLDDPEERKRLIDALQKTFNSVLVWPRNRRGLSSEIPRIRFEMLPEALADLISSFKFNLPPYFLNNMRCLATLEGIALKLDPQFNILRVIYPYSINRLMCNPAISAVVEENFMDICRSPKTKLFDPKRVTMLLNDWSLFTGYQKRKIFWDLASSRGGRQVGWRIFREWYRKYSGRVHKSVTSLIRRLLLAR